jgi:hypothetical protein
MSCRVHWVFLELLGHLRGIMSPAQLKMQPTIHWNEKPDNMGTDGKYPGLSPDVLWVAFSIPLVSFFLVNHVYRAINNYLHKRRL